MAIKLIIEPVDDPLNSMTHELDQSLVTVGRSKSCHIELDHPGISRRHFIIKYAETGYVIIDERSRHGTSLDQARLEPELAHILGREHVIDVPGFRITFMCDGERPRLERTTVVARQLLDDLLQGEARSREVPSLRAKTAGYHFQFVEQKTTFVLGSLAHADFVVSDDAIAKKHVSFIRDIFGIRVVPTAGNAVFIDHVLVTEPQLLTTGAVLTVGAIDFVYADTEAHSFAELESSSSTSSAHVDEKPALENVSREIPLNYDEAKKGKTLRALDRVFAFGFVVALLGAVVVIANLR